MAFISLKEFLGRMGLATAGQVDEWSKAWRIAVESGSQETLLGFICRERGLAEDVPPGGGVALARLRHARANELLEVFVCGHC